MKPAEVKALAGMLDRIDYYRLLKIEPASSLAQIRPAYRDARRRFHPDDFLTADDDVRVAVDQIARRIIEAYMVLRDRARRSAYDRTLGRGNVRYTAETHQDAKAEANAQRGLTANGRRFFALAVEDERRGDVARALSNLKMALTFEPSNATFKARLEQLQSRQPSA